MPVPCKAFFANVTSRVSPPLRRTLRALVFEPLEARQLLAILTVGTGGQYATIQGAVDAARPGDVVLVGDGQYAESVDLSRMGMVRGGPIGDLTIRGTAVDAAILPPAGQAAFYTSSAFAGDLGFQRLTIGGDAVVANTRGFVFNRFVGDLFVEELVFDRLTDAAIQLTEMSGDLWIQSSLFARVGDAASDAAVRVSQFSGAAIITGNDFDDVQGAAIEFSNSAGLESAWLIDDNRIYDDDAQAATTVTAVRARLAGSGRTDLILDGNSFEGLNGAAIDILVREQAQLQTRWTFNQAANLRGAVAAQMTFRDAAVGALLSETNTWSDMSGSGVSIRLENAARLRATVQYDTFLAIGDGVAGPGGMPDEALTLTTAAGATGVADVFWFNNSFSSIAGNGARVVAGGGTVRAVIAANHFDQTNLVTPGAALVVEHASQASGATIDLRLEDNHVYLHQSDAYLLKQHGTAVMRLERASGTAAAHLAARNVGVPVTVTGTIGTLAPGSLDAVLPLTLGDTLWWDNGDSVQNVGEPGAGGIVIRLSGIESASGEAVQRMTQSDSKGVYYFPGLVAGQYTLTLELPFAVRLADRKQGSDATADSDFDSVTAQASVVLTAGQDDLTIDAGLWRTWQNPRNPLDVNDDGVVTPLDVLLLINDLNARGTRPLPIPPSPPSLAPPYLDVNGDNVIGPLDALIVINYLNAMSGGGGAGEGEGDGAAFPLAESARGGGQGADGRRSGADRKGPRVLSRPSRTLPMVRGTEGESATVRRIAPARHVDERDAFFAQWEGDFDCLP